MVYDFIPSSSDILGIILLLFLFVILHKNNFMLKEQTRYYQFVVLMTLLIIILEIITDYLNFNASPNLRSISFVVNILGFSLMFTLSIILAMLYSKRIYLKRYLYLIPSFIGFILCVLSIKTGWIFWITPSGRYERGSLFIINIIISLYGFIILLRAHNDMSKEYEQSERYYLWILYFIVLGTSFLQIFCHQIEIMWGGIAITELLYFIFLQSLQFKYDQVTGLRNRTCFNQSIERLKPNDRLFLIVFDVNNLKEINDNYGHDMGDEFLLWTANILKDAFHSCGKLYRIGGDEFAVIATNCDEKTIFKSTQNMLQLVQESSTRFPVSYYIAHGCCQYNALIHQDAYQCLHDADLKMYENKNKSKCSQP